MDIVLQCSIWVCWMRLGKQNGNLMPVDSVFNVGKYSIRFNGLYHKEPQRTIVLLRIFAAHHQVKHSLNGL